MIKETIDKVKERILGRLERALDNRNTTSFGVSIGTGLMLESIFNPTTDRYDLSREVPNQIKINDYDKYYINIQTLIRNIYSSLVDSVVKKDVLDDLAAVQLTANVLIDELFIISELFEGKNCTPVLFVPKYDEFLRTIPEYKISTGKLGMFIFVKSVTNVFMKNHEEVPMEVLSNTLKLPMNKHKVLLTTSNAIDLLNIKHIKNLELLESHTGKLKRKNQFNSKYHSLGVSDMSILPFDEKLLKILGDKHSIPPGKIKVRRDIYNTAVANNWNFVTTVEKIISDLKKTDYDLYQMFLDLDRKF